MKTKTTGIMASVVLALAAISEASTLYENNFDKGLSDWTTSDSSVSIKDNQYLYIDSNNWGLNSWAVKSFSIDLTSNRSIVIEQRMKLESGGLNYRLPSETIFFENSSSLSVTYLPNFPDIEPNSPPYGWNFGGWTGNHNHAVPGSGFWTSATADYWAVTKIILTPTGGELLVKPDDAVKNWFSDEFYGVAAQTWSHSGIESIQFSQPWDSVVYIDYIKITSEAPFIINPNLPSPSNPSVPEPGTLALLALGGLMLLKRRKMPAMSG